MQMITFVPGAVVSPGAITLPDEAPNIDAVVAARIVRLSGAQADHPIHTHAVGADTSGTTELAEIAGGRLNVGAGGEVGDAAAMAHVGTDPLVVAVPAKLTSRTFSLSVDTEVDDVLHLSYIEVGERVPVS
jgi:hypothetical protein